MQKNSMRDAGFPFTEFDPDRPIDWVWGYSFLQERPILVPELLAYYSLGGRSQGFVYETSNGCALGGSLEEAILYGIFEVVVARFVLDDLVRADAPPASGPSLH